jgi:hypothetical protein
MKAGGGLVTVVIASGPQARAAIRQVRSGIDSVGHMAPDSWLLTPSSQLTLRALPPPFPTALL